VHRGRGHAPVLLWVDQEITPLERYVGVKQDMQDLAQQLLIFGTHVHIGIEDREFLIDAMNVSRYFLPHLLCLTSSSPFWMGRNTGLKSYRSVVFRNFPRTGIPRVMQSHGATTSTSSRRWSAHAASRTARRSTGTCGRTTAIPTLEFRFCDVCTRVEEAVCLAAILQAIIAKLWKLRRDNMTFRVYPPT
jgi:glutamate---cysteine ligase / carboxylate-amine ligase